MFSMSDIHTHQRDDIQPENANDNLTSETEKQSVKLSRTS